MPRLVAAVGLMLSALLAAPQAVAGELEVFTIPDANPPNGLYRINIQQTYPAVDWSTLDVLCLPPGQYKFINLGNLPQRNAERPLSITNCGGQVRVGGLGHHYLFVLGGGSNWRLSGRYSEAEGLGDAAFTGHAGGNYADSAGRYGILVDDETIEEGNPSGIAVGGGASDFEIEFVEVRRVGFAGMLIKTDNNGGATMRNVRIHDTYVHDVGSEGLYIGSTQGQPQHSIDGLRFFNNRVVRTGTEIFQLGQIGGDSEVYNNVFMLGALDWKNPFQNFQNNATQLGPRFGSFVFRNNIVIGAAASWINFLGNVVAGDPQQPGSVVEVRDNYYSDSRHFGAYVARLTRSDTTYRFRGNRMRRLNFQLDETDPGQADYNQFFRLGSGGVANTSPIEFIDNHYDGSQRFISNWSDPNQTIGNVSGSGNQQVSIPPVRFVDSGFSADYDYLRIEIWTADTAAGAPVDYLQGDVVSVDGDLFRCTPAAGCAAGVFPPDAAASWSPLPPPPDDLRVHVDSPIQNVGLLDIHRPDLLFANGFELD